MISATLSTLNGNKVELRIPQSGLEIPFKRYFPAKYYYDILVDQFVETKKFDEFAQLHYIIMFVAVVLGREPNEIMGFNKGVFKDNMVQLGAARSHLNWDSIDDTLYSIYRLLFSVFKEIEPSQPEHDYEFTYKEIEFCVPKVFGEVDVWSDDPLPDMPVWQSIELCQLRLMFSRYLNDTKVVDKLGNEVPLQDLKDEDRMDYFAKYYTVHLNMLACVTNKKGRVDMSWMNGQDAIDNLITKRTQFFIDIDCQTAIDVFFFAMNISKYSNRTIISNIGLILQSQAAQLLPNKRRRTKR